MISSLLTKTDQTQSAAELCREMTVLDTLQWITLAWIKTKESTIQKCFALAGFPNMTADPTDNTTYNDDDDIPLSELAKKL